MGTHNFVPLISLLVSSIAYSQTIQPVRVPIDPVTEFNRCYGLLTGQRPVPSHPRLQAVIAAKQNSQNIAMDECEAMLEEAVFEVDSGNVTGFPSVVNSDSNAIMNQMLRLFMNFFENNDMETRPQGQVIFGETRHYSGIEGAIYMTELLLNPQSDFTDFTRGNHSVRSIRTSRATLADPLGGLYYRLPIIGNAFIYSGALEKGPLRGIVRRTPQENNEFLDVSGIPHTTFDLYAGFNDPLGNGELETSPVQPSLPPWTFLEVTTGQFKAKHAYGGGLFGLAGYIISNHGFNSHNQKSDGGFRVPRRLMSRIFKDTLCIDEAPLRTTDVVQEVAEYQIQFPNGNLPFRASTACSSCHVAFDRSPYDNFYTALVNNVQFGISPFVNATTLVTRFPIDNGVWQKSNDGTFTSFSVTPPHFTGTEFSEPLNQFKPRLSTPPHLIEKDDEYFLRPDDFDLTYRDYAGNLVYNRVQVQTGENSVELFGQLMENQNQLYVCMAKKMAKYLWNKDISVMDPQDSRNPKLTYADQFYKDEIVAMGLNFKNHRSLKQLMLDMMRHPIFTNTGFLGFKQ